MKKIFIILPFILIPAIAFGAIIDCPYLRGGKNLLNYPNEVQPSSTNLGPEIEKLIKNIIHFLKECLVKPALVAIIIWGGIYIMISMGDPGKITKGKQILLAGIIGLIIIFVAEEIAGLFGKYIH